MKHLGFVWLGK